MKIHMRIQDNIFSLFFNKLRKDKDFENDFIGEFKNLRKKEIITEKKIKKLIEESYKNV
jgi:hypothetical protein